MTAVAFLILAALTLLGLLSWQVKKLYRLVKKETYGKQTESSAWPLAQTLSQTRAYLLISIGILGFLLLAIAYLVVRDTGLEGHFWEWLNLLIRWFHITIGIVWIGASFYFVFLENSLNRTKGLRKGIAGNLWAVHGGGFYYVEKYKVAPDVIPQDLHWFKYEAYFTWISGFVLLWIVYYFNAEAMLIDKNVADISTVTGIGIGIGSLVISWLGYDLLCKTDLLHKGIWFSLVSFLLLTLLAWALSQVFTSRAAYIHIGAVLGTLMAGNVFWVIIPSQKALVKAAKEGKPLDPSLGKNAGLRSLHNNYMTLPVLFVMISNHFPSTFGHPWNWAVLAAISLAGAGIKHYHNLTEKGEPTFWILPVSIAVLIGLFFVTAPESNREACETEVPFTEIYRIMAERCVSCHSSQPTDEGWTAPPNGVKYDTPEEIVKMKDKIMQRAVLTRTMPQNNKTGMTLEERDLLRCWIEQGAKVE